MSWFTEMDVVLVAAASIGWNLKASFENITKKRCYLLIKRNLFWSSFWSIALLLFMWKLTPFSPCMRNCDIKIRSPCLLISLEKYKWKNNIKFPESKRIHSLPRCSYSYTSQHQGKNPKQLIIIINNASIKTQYLKFYKENITFLLLSQNHCYTKLFPKTFWPFTARNNILFFQ